jgi:hypothetical protein
MLHQGQAENPDMVNNTYDKGWEQLQAHIERFLGQTLRNDVRAIEYKPRFNPQLLESSSNRLQDNRKPQTT